MDAKKLTLISSLSFSLNVMASSLAARARDLSDNELIPIMSAVGVIGIIIGAIMWALGRHDGAGKISGAVVAVSIGLASGSIIDVLKRIFGQ